METNPYEPPAPVGDTSPTISMMRWPAFGLLLAGVILVGWSLWAGASNYRGIEANTRLSKGEQREALAGVRNSFAFSAAMGILQATGGVLLLLRRARWLAILACLSGIFLVCVPTVILAAPSAAWALILLRQRDRSTAAKKRPHASPSG